MSTPINIDELKAIKIYPSKERALDGTCISDLTALVWKMEDDAMSRPLNSPMPAGWFCDISPAGLDLWAEQAHKRVMESVDELIAKHNMLQYWYKDGVPIMDNADVFRAYYERTGLILR
jgi:hypothetical protein